MFKCLNPPKFFLKKFGRVNIKMNKGMTLIEVLTVIAIMLILMAAVFINPRPEVELDRAARQLATSLHQVQNRAMAVEEGWTGAGLTNPTCYGFRITGLRNYSQYYYAGNTLSPCSQFNMITLGDLPQGVIFIAPSIGTEINFLIPSGNICIGNSLTCCCGAGSLTESLDIILQASDGSTETITVTSAGKIEIQ